MAPARLPSPVLVLAALLFAGALCIVGAAPARAEDPAAPAAPAPPKADPRAGLATDAEAAQALETFQEAFKAPGLKGDERTAVREVAMRALAAVQHPLVTDRLERLTKDRDADVRALATMYLGDQKKLAGYAGKAVLATLGRSATDPLMVMYCTDAVQALDFRGAVTELRTLLAHKDESIRKHALTVIGEMKEMRMIDDVLQLMIDLKIDKGMKWEGGEVTVDTGAAGDADQKAAEAAYKEKYGTKAARGKAGGRKMRDMKPLLLEAMKNLTGQEFATTAQAKAWIDAHKAEITAKQEELNRLQIAQRDAAKALAESLKK